MSALGVGTVLSLLTVLVAIVASVVVLALTALPAVETGAALFLMGALLGLALPPLADRLLAERWP